MQKYNHLTTRAITINGDWCRWLIMNVLFLHFGGVWVWVGQGCALCGRGQGWKELFLFVRFIFFDYFCILKD